MFRPPSRKKKAREEVYINIVPLLDATFVFLFFLMFSTAFVHFYEVPSIAPMASSTPEKENPKNPPLALTLRIIADGIEVYTGVPAELRRKIPAIGTETYDLEELRKYLFQLKNENPNEKAAIINPEIDMTYEKLIDVIDSIRMFKKEDPIITKKEKDGKETKVEEFFPDVLFGNTQS